jgi:transposase
MLITPAQTLSERVDDIPLILHWLKQMEIASIIDQKLMPAHKNRTGLSYGQLSVLFVAYIVSQSDHRLCHVESWVRTHQKTLELATGWKIGDKDNSDDRLADLLSAIGNSDEISTMEEAMGRHIVRAYALPTEIARCDSSSFSVYHQNKEEGESAPLIQYGYSKDHRPDLRQYRHALGTIDPAGIPLVSATLPGNGDDDSMYYPFWYGLVSAIGHREFIYIADAKAASYQTRAQLNQAGGIYCFPLPMTGQIPERLQQWVLSPPDQLQPIMLPQQSPEETPACLGFELSLGSLWQIPQTTRCYHWQERYLVIRSEALAQRQIQGLNQRLEKTQQALDKLAAKPASDCCDLKNQVQAILKRYRSQDYFTTTIHSQQVTRYTTPGRPSTKKPNPQQTIERWCLQFQRQSAAIEHARTLCGWRLYVTNAPWERLTLTDAVYYYRQQWQLERGFHRFKRGNLPALPVYLQDQTRIIGLMFLLTVALRVFTLMEFVVHQQLLSLQRSLDGLYAGNPKRMTARPSAEQLLAAFGGITLYFLRDGTLEITPLNSLQQRILALMRVPLSIYQFEGLSNIIPVLF